MRLIPGRPRRAVSDAERQRLAYQREIARALRPRWTPRRVVAVALMTAGPLIALQHVAAHLGARLFSYSMGWQDITIGYPAAVVVGLIGLVLLDRRPKE